MPINPSSCTSNAYVAGLSTSPTGSGDAETTERRYLCAFRRDLTEAGRLLGQISQSVRMEHAYHSDKADLETKAKALGQSIGRAYADRNKINNLNKALLIQRIHLLQLSNQQNLICHQFENSSVEFIFGANRISHDDFPSWYRSYMEAVDAICSEKNLFNLKVFINHGSLLVGCLIMYKGYLPVTVMKRCRIDLDSKHIVLKNKEGECFPDVYYDGFDAARMENFIEKFNSIYGAMNWANDWIWSTSVFLSKKVFENASKSLPADGSYLTILRSALIDTLRQRVESQSKVFDLGALKLATYLALSRFLLRRLNELLNTIPTDSKNQRLLTLQKNCISKAIEALCKLNVFWFKPTLSTFLFWLKAKVPNDPWVSKSYNSFQRVGGASEDSFAQRESPFFSLGFKSKYDQFITSMEKIPVVFHFDDLNIGESQQLAHLIAFELFTIHQELMGGLTAENVSSLLGGMYESTLDWLMEAIPSVKVEDLLGEFKILVDELLKPKLLVHLKERLEIVDEKKKIADKIQLTESELLKLTCISDQELDEMLSNRKRLKQELREVNKKIRNSECSSTERQNLEIKYREQMYCIQQRLVSGGLITESALTQLTERHLTINGQNRTKHARINGYAGRYSDELAMYNHIVDVQEYLEATLQHLSIREDNTYTDLDLPVPFDGSVVNEFGSEMGHNAVVVSFYWSSQGSTLPLITHMYPSFFRSPQT